MTRLKKAMLAATLALGLAASVPLAQPAGAHVPNGGGNHFSNCTQWVLQGGRPFQQGDTGGCVSVIQYWLNEIRYLRLLDGRRVPPEWTNLAVDAKWGPLTSAAVIVFQDIYMPYVNGKADLDTMYKMWGQCLDVSEASSPQPPCDHV